ncbi:MAG: DUF4232 domain-containing protein [Chloroflexota bacterium]|nr:DUF4232 domain-containing protein [Chloroflexota bacterium]
MLTVGGIAAVAAVTGALLGNHSPARASARVAASQPRCLNIQLNITPGRSNGAAGHIAILYRLHNMRATACTLTGYPGVRLLGRSFRDLPTHLHRGGLVLDGRRTPSTVSVASHGNAWFALEYRDVPAADGSCTMATYLMIFPPNDYLPVIAYAGQGGVSVRACAGELEVSPVTAGNAGF